jgi:dihydroneopterin aldolase
MRDSEGEPRRHKEHEEDAKGGGMTDRIILRGIQFYGYHGVPDAEQATGHRYEVDLVLETDVAAAAAADDVTQTVDYGVVARDVLEIGTSRQFRLIETLAMHIAEQVLASQSRVEAVTVGVKKLQPPIPGVVEFAAIEITRRRQADAPP